jgi:hypothetical protein
MRRVVVMVAILCGTARGDGSQDRAAYIAGLFDAIQTSDKDTRRAVADFIYAADRNKCQAPIESLHVGCLLEAAEHNCQTRGAQGDDRRDACLRLSDVIVTNRLSEGHFVPRDVRYELMEKNKDYRAALERELRKRYAIMVSQFVMSKHFPGSRADNAALATGLEGYCRELSGQKDVSWQYCVAAVVWFIGTEDKP